jgi:phosphatidyl-myo-inositol alpha-mannosyltransferase
MPRVYSGRYTRPRAPATPGADCRLTVVKVGIVVPFSWSFWGGVSEHADLQARALLDLGHDVRVIMGHDPPGRLTKLLHPRTGRHDRPPEYVIPVGRSVIAPANGTLPNIILSPAAITRMRRVFQREQFDVLHVHEPYTPILSIYALVAAPAPIVTTSHASAERLRWYDVGRVTWGPMHRRIDYRVAVSERARESAEPYIGGPFEIIPNGVIVPPDAEAHGRENRVVFVGRHEPRKGLAVLLRAWPEVHRQTGARLRVVGADPLSVRWLLRRERLGGEGVDLLGSVSEEALTEELLSAKALCAPSLGRESFGMVLTRAFACATPVVASDIEGYTDVATPQTSVLVPPGDRGALESALVALLGDEDRRRKLGHAARELAERRYAWEGIARRLVEIYEGLVGIRREAVAA